MTAPAAHGRLGRMTEKIKIVGYSLLFVAIPLLSGVGCGTLMRPEAQAAADVTDAACALGLVQSAATVAQAELEGVPVDWLAEQLCRMPDVVDALAAAQKARAVDPGRAALRVARAKGLVR